MGIDKKQKQVRREKAGFHPGDPCPVFFASA
jgi:hypothetical protein